VATPKEIFFWIGRNAKRITVTVVGFALILLGLAMLVLPGPGLLVIIAGLAVLATQYAWAERALDTAKRKAKAAAAKARRKMRRDKRREERREPSDPT
jgi:uncharacterized protein (TIGR02611 family)